MSQILNGRKHTEISMFNSKKNGEKTTLMKTHLFEIEITQSLEFDTQNHLRVSFQVTCTFHKIWKFTVSMFWDLLQNRFHRWVLMNKTRFPALTPGNFLHTKLIPWSIAFLRMVDCWFWVPVIWDSNKIPLPSLKLRYPLKMDGWKTSFLLGWPIFRCYVSCREGK